MMSPSSALAWVRSRLQHAAWFLTISFNRFLEAFFASKHPAVVAIRESIRRNRMLLSSARIVIRAVRSLPRLQEALRNMVKRREIRRLEAIMAARMVGGSLTADELDQIWQRSGRRSRALVMADGPELEQIEIMLRSARARITLSGANRDGAGSLDLTAGGFNLIVVGPGEGPEPLAAEHVLKVGRVGKRSDYMSLAKRHSSAAIHEAGGLERKSLREKLARGETLRLVCLNDVGFQYGAGIALRRQAASFLLRGFEVHLVSWTPGQMDGIGPRVTGVGSFEGWQGVWDISKKFDKVSNEDRVLEELLSILRTIDPDVIVTGNLHSTKFPLELAERLRDLDALVVSYMHDCYWATGRCAYPVGCNLYLTGCDETCPTAAEYPRLAPERIGPSWSAKSRIFEGKAGIPLAVNSGWTKSIALQRFGNRARIDCVPLAVDHELFSPMSKAVARRLLGLPVEGAFVVMGAVDILNKWKGGELFQQLLQRLHAHGDVSILLFGQSSGLLKCTKSFGLVEDEGMMPLILNAADIFIGTATEEAFGQTLLEASACGLPVVAFDRGGISDVVVDGETGLLVKDLDADALYEAVGGLLADSRRRETLGRNARRRVEAHFTLIRQSNVWLDYLRDLSELRLPG